MLLPPTFDSIDSYGARLSDAEYWYPYAEAALARADLSERTLASGFVGTYPALVGEQFVVKLFGYFPGWRESAITELAANRAIGPDKKIRAPKIIASGSLFPESDNEWPFRVMERLTGRAWRDAHLSPQEALLLAARLGEQIRLVHESEAPNQAHLRKDWIASRGQEAVERQRSWGSLPEHLIDQIPGYLTSYRPDQARFVHADLTEDHIFIDHDELVGIIDWGDAMITDPYYDLGALHLGAFAGDRRLLGSFLRGYRWIIGQDFADHALQVALMHQFNLFEGVTLLASQAHSLTDLAQAIWTPD